MIPEATSVKNLKIPHFKVLVLVLARSQNMLNILVCLQFEIVFQPAY